MNDKYRMMSKIVRNLNLEKNKKGMILNENEAEALRYIIKHDGCIASDIAYNLCIDKGLVTRIIKKLISLDYIYLSEGFDKRKKHLYACEIAKAYKENNEKFEVEYYQKITKDIDSEELEAFFEILNKIYRCSKKYRKERNYE